MTTVRRAFLKNGAAAAMAAALPSLNFAQTAPAPSRGHFAPQSGAWRTFDVTTRVDIVKPQGVTKVWLPIPSVNSDYQHSLGNSFSSNGSTLLTQDGRDGAKMLYVEFPATESQALCGTDQPRADPGTRHRLVAENRRGRKRRHAALLHAPDHADPDRRHRAQDRAGGDARREDRRRKSAKALRLDRANTYREPKVRGCGEGDIKTMLETGNLGGKCADLNALFVGLCRSVGVPARDVYGIRLAPSAFGYKELGQPGQPQGRAALPRRGLPQGPRLGGDGPGRRRQGDAPGNRRLDQDHHHPVVAPVNKALFGGWEGNWMAYNTAHDVALPKSAGEKLGFFMYPIAETQQGALIPTRRTISSTRSRRKILSFRMGMPRACMCTRSWCFLPVTGLSA
jgi:hypothetical protein